MYPVFCVKSKMAVNTSSDYVDINITVAMLAVDAFHELQVNFSFIKYVFSFLITRLLFHSISVR